MKTYLIRFGVAALAVTCAFAILLLVATRSDAIVDPPPVDHSDPDLVRSYIAMPCDGLDELYSFLYEGMVFSLDAYKECLDKAANDPDFRYGYLKCYYVKLQWDLLDSHASSIEKAWNLMCDDHGVRKNPEYYIDF